LKNLRNVLVEVLAENPNWNAKKYYNIVKREADCTYQGVHKTLRLLVEEGVAEEKEKTYSLSRKWLARNAEFSKQALAKLDDTLQTFFEYDSFIDFSSEFIRILERESAKIPENGVCVTYSKHAWPALGLVGDSFQRLKNVIANSAVKMHCEGDTPGDRSTMKMYADGGCWTRTGFRLPDQKTDWISHECSDFFSQIIFPADFMKKLGSIYAKGDVGQNATELLALLHSPAKITVIITYNKKLAAKYAEKVLKADEKWSKVSAHRP
jgi:hypothetical protein